MVWVDIVFGFNSVNNAGWRLVIVQSTSTITVYCLHVKSKLIQCLKLSQFSGMCMLNLAIINQYSLILQSL